MFEAIITYFSGTLGMVELFGTIFSVICVYLAVKHNIWTWFWGALGVLCFGYLFYEFKLYSDAGLQLLFFLPMQAMGWYWWTKESAKAGTKSVVKSLDPVLFAIVGAFILGATFVNGWFMANLTDASFPYIDALTTWMSVAAQLLMIAKYRESWVLWVGMDVIAIGVYFAKGLLVTSGLYVVFLVLATMGGIKWYRDYVKQEMENA